MGVTQGTGSAGSGSGLSSDEGLAGAEVVEVGQDNAPQDDVHETTGMPSEPFLVADDPTPASVFTGAPAHFDPIIEEGQGYEAAGNCYPQGVDSKVNEARAAITDYRTAQAEADRLRGEASTLVDRALDDSSLADPDVGSGDRNVDDLRQFQYDPTP